MNNEYNILRNLIINQFPYIKLISFKKIDSGILIRSDIYRNFNKDEYLNFLIEFLKISKFERIGENNHINSIVDFDISIKDGDYSLDNLYKIMAFQ